MSADTRDLEARLAAIEAPRLAEERARELARLRAEAAAAEVRLPELARCLEEMRGERAEAERKLAEVEHTVAEQRARVAQLGMRELPVEREIASCWAAIAAARDAARPVRTPVPERRPSTVADVRDAVLAWFRRLRDRHPLPTPAMRPDQFLAARVRLLQSCVCAGEGRPVGWVGFVPDSEVDVLVGNNRAVVLERRIVADRQMPAVAMARAVRGTRGPNGEALAAGAVVPVDAPTRDAIVSGRLSSLELIGEDVEIEKRIAAMQAKVAELAVRFPQGAGA